MSIDEIINKIIRVDGDLDDFIWDEWYLYKDVNSFLTIYEEFYSSFNKIVKEFDYICSIGKSGFPLAAKFAFDVKKPLIISSLSEYIYDGRTFVLGIPPDVDVKNKKIFCIDSHVRTGGSIELANTLLQNRYSKEVSFFVLFDCRASHNVERPINSLYKWKEIEPSLINSGVQATRILDDEFWMKEDKYWLMDVASEEWELSENVIPQKSAKEIVIMQEKFSQFQHNDKIEPLKLYMEPDAFHLFIEKCIEEIKDSGVDFFIAASVSAIPMAFVLSSQLKRAGIQFLFIMNEPKKYYSNELKEAKGIALCDDVLSTGGLLYAIANLLIDDAKNKVKFVITICDLNQFPEIGRKYIHYLINLVSPLFLTAFKI